MFLLCFSPPHPQIMFSCMCIMWYFHSYFLLVSQLIIFILIPSLSGGLFSFSFSVNISKYTISYYIRACLYNACVWSVYWHATDDDVHMCDRDICGQLKGKAHHHSSKDLTRIHFTYFVYNSALFHPSLYGDMDIRVYGYAVVCVCVIHSVLLHSIMVMIQKQLIHSTISPISDGIHTTQKWKPPPPFRSSLAHLFGPRTKCIHTHL